MKKLRAEDKDVNKLTIRFPYIFEYDLFSLKLSSRKENDCEF